MGALGLVKAVDVALGHGGDEPRIEQPTQLLEQIGVGLAMLHLGQPALRA